MSQLIAIFIVVVVLRALVQPPSVFYLYSRLLMMLEIEYREYRTCSTCSWNVIGVKKVVIIVNESRVPSIIRSAHWALL